MGWFNIFAAVYKEGSAIFDFSLNSGKQFIFIIASFTIASIILMIETKFFTFFSYPIYIFAMLFLVAVLILGTEKGGSKSWFGYGGIGVQPSEFAKFATALAIAKLFSSLNGKLPSIRTKLLSILIIAIPITLILLQHDTGSALVFASFIFVFYREGLSGKIFVFGIAIAILFIAALLINELTIIIILSSITLVLIYFLRKRKKEIFALIGFLAAAIIFIHSVHYVFNNVLKDHQRIRINVLLGKEIDLKGAGYNVNQSKIAIGSGGFWGKGFLKGTQTKYDFVPEQSTDFIFCTIGEEWGFLGSLFVIGLFIWLLIRIVQIAERQRQDFARIYGWSVAAILFFHFTINIGMTIGLVPVIGIPLPFFSYGGSSLWAFTILLFVLIRMDAKRI